jgi:hypothetical protein
VLPIKLIQIDLENILFWEVELLENVLLLKEHSFFFLFLSFCVALFECLACLFFGLIVSDVGRICVLTVLVRVYFIFLLLDVL